MSSDPELYTFFMALVITVSKSKENESVSDHNLSFSIAC